MYYDKRSAMLQGLLLMGPRACGFHWSCILAILGLATLVSVDLVQLSYHLPRAVFLPSGRPRLLTRTACSLNKHQETICRRGYSLAVSKRSQLTLLHSSACWPCCSQCHLLPAHARPTASTRASAYKPFRKFQLVSRDESPGLDLIDCHEAVCEITVGSALHLPYGRSPRAAPFANHSIGFQL